MNNTTIDWKIFFFFFCIFCSGDALEFSSLHPYFLHMLTSGCCFIPVHAYGQAVVFVLQFKIHMRPICAYGVVILSLTVQRIPFWISLSIINHLRARSPAPRWIGICKHHESIGVLDCVQRSTGSHYFPSLSESIRSAEDNGRSFKCTAVNDAFRVLKGADDVFFSAFIGCLSALLSMQMEFNVIVTESIFALVAVIVESVSSWSGEFKHTNLRLGSVIS